MTDASPAAALSPALARLLSGMVVPCRPWPRRVLAPEAWAAFAQDLAADRNLSFLGLWADPVEVHALFLNQAGYEVLPVSTPVRDGGYAALSPHRPAAAWFERMVRDLWGHAPAGGRDQRPWLDHGRWGAHLPLSPHPVPASAAPEPPEFLPFDGDALHQHALGPVRPGIAEPGHLRLTGQGEAVLRAEFRLGYAHRGVLSLLHGKTPAEAAPLASRICGDGAVAHATAFACAAEAALSVAAPPRALHLRAAMLELERIAGHLDAAVTPCGERFAVHREGLRRAAHAAFGHRLMMDAVIPGGATDIAPEGADAVRAAIAALRRDLPALHRAAAAADLAGIGQVPPDLAARFGAGGPVGRAAGRRFDARALPGAAPYDWLDPAFPLRHEGDAAARLAVRLAETEESARLLNELLATLPDGPAAIPLPPGSGEGIGCAEGARGDTWHWLRLQDGTITAAFARDAGWPHLPLLEHAIAEGDLADLSAAETSIPLPIAGLDL